MLRPRHQRGVATAQQQFRSIRDFYRYYKQQHRKLGTRVLHFAGTTAFLALCVVALVKAQPWFAAAGVVSAYLLAWLGHYFVEHNRPATFKYPLWSLGCDFVMYFNLLVGKERFQLEACPD